MENATITKTGFDRLYSWAELAAMPREERIQYEESLKRYRDELSHRDTELNARRRAREEGLAIGLKKGKEEGLAEGEAIGLMKGKEEGSYAEKLRSAKKMKDKGIDVQTIIDITGLTLEEVNVL